MKNIKFLILLYLVFVNINSNAQTITDLSIKICDSIKTHKYVESDTIELKQAEIYSKLLSEYLLKKEPKAKSFKNDYNSLNYKLTRELNKTCETYKFKNSVLLPFSNLVEIDSLFSNEQSENINKIAKEIRNKNQIQIVILSIDELYPSENIDEFSFNKLIDWKVGGVYEKSGVIIVFSKKLRLARISTTYISKKYLTDESCDKIMHEIMIPNFKNENYYDGIYKSLVYIKNITK
ncbi:TPM domain-containing protein [Flavobacterium sp.]|uniref:TPM domain-containing protein n=1 Tax=Flavobacterium sp. TaxID=239 RepID=UPI003D6B52E4